MLHRIGELEQGEQQQQQAATAAGKEEHPIIHSVNVRTNSAIREEYGGGGGGKYGGPNGDSSGGSPIKELVSSSRRSSRSQGDLAEAAAAVQIEVKGGRKAASQDHLALKSGQDHLGARSPNKQASVSVVNLSSPTRSSR